MSTVASRRFVLVCVSAVLILVFALHFVPNGQRDGTTEAGDGTADADVAESAESFTIEGSATEPISPGVMAPLDLSLTNPHASAMSVTDLRVRVQKVSAPNADAAHPCAAGDFAVAQGSSSRKITLAARATRTLSNLGLPRASWPHVGMLNRPANQDGCKGASLTLAYTASGSLEN